MSALVHLKTLLQSGVEAGARPMTSTIEIDELLADMRRRGAAGAAAVPEDIQLEAVQRFWDSMSISTFRDTLLLSWAISLPHKENGACILEDRPRFHKVLLAVVRQKDRPRAFRRCFQGLLKNYFFYDGLAETAPAIAQKNWEELRNFLKVSTVSLEEDGQCPDWVRTVCAQMQLFTNSPCEHFVPALLGGDSHEVDLVAGQVGISQSSWFFRRLILDQIEVASRRGHTEFRFLLGHLLSAIATRELLQDRALTLLLDRYAQIPDAKEHPKLRDAAVSRWQNPWLPSNEKHWGSVSHQARAMISDWLKREFIQEFFLKLAEEGASDTRRMKFWLRHVKMITKIEFALGATVRKSRDRDLVVLKQKMTGLICELEAQHNNAFIMTMGSIVAVEFSAAGNAFYAYDARKTLPFDTDQRLVLGVDHANSLKSQARAKVYLRHADGVHGWTRWEEMFEERLGDAFRTTAIDDVTLAKPKPMHESRAPTRLSTVLERHSPSTLLSRGELAARPYSREVLEAYVQKIGGVIDDKSGKGGNLWVLAEAEWESTDRVLKAWGFRYKAAKGWWK